MVFNVNTLTFQQWLVVSIVLGAALGALMVTVWMRRSLQQQRDSYQQKMTEQLHLLESSSVDYSQLQERYSRLQQDQMSALEEKATLQGRLSQLAEIGQRLEVKDQRIIDLNSDNSALKTELQHVQTHVEAQKQMLESTRVSLTSEFERLSNKIFQDKHQLFQETSQRSLDNSIAPLKEKIGDFKKQIETFYSKENSDRNQLIGKIGELQDQTKKIGEDAVNLANALKGDNKVQGAWGEVVLQRLLEESGLQKGREYDTQLAYKNDDNKIRNPDVVIYLPDNKQLVIDAKMSLTHYEQSVSASNKADVDIALKAHVASVRSHIKLLSKKNYENLQGINSLDFVFIFMPIDAAFIASLQHDPSLFQYAFDQHIVLVSPSTLMATLRTVSNIWRFHKQHEHAEEIAKQAGGLYDQFALVLESLDELDRNLSKTKESFVKAKQRLSTGRGNMIGRVENLRVLGAKTKKRLPVGFASKPANPIIDADNNHSARSTENSPNTQADAVE